MIAWLRAAMLNSPGHLREAYLFGSALDARRKPRDIDVVLVTDDHSGGPGWFDVRRWRDRLAEQFEDRFGLPLSAMVVTPSEWAEIDGIIVREREPLV